MSDPRPPGSAPDPRFIFVDDSGQDHLWDARACSGRIGFVADGLRQGLAQGAAIGLLFRTGPDLVLHWLACLQAGLRPLIMQYPTRKQSRAYWADSVSNTVTTVQLAAILADEHCCGLCSGLQLPQGVELLPASGFGPGERDVAGRLLPDDFAILQLSSGTTGYRKAMEFGSAALASHAADFNLVLDLVPGRDRIVSWLPLYHDMGYVACFVMPMLLGIEVVMMDPVDWVARPELLFEAIVRHRGTVCYMPNFGFEVMTRAPAPAMDSMRHWISCSEPVSAATAQKFCRHAGVAEAAFSPCYAMAENLFAVSFGTGWQTRSIDGVEVVSCGAPIAGVSVKIVDEQIWVRSPVSLASYLDGADIRDADGFYPTGDRGVLADGALYVAGRMGDVLIQAGRKFMLTDMDLKLNALCEHARGRAATLAMRDDRLGTEVPLVLIEAQDFFARTDMAALAAQLIDATGIDQLEVVYVPPRFITKTSSGKVNRRKTRDDYMAVLAARTATGGKRDAVAELRTAFPHVDWQRPIREVLDSLSRTIVQITLETTGVPFDPAMTLQALEAELRADSQRAEAQSDAVDGMRIVSLADRRLLLNITEDDLARMEQTLGCPVTIEHICLPPAPVLMSDLVFHDWFQPRLDQSAFGNVDQALDRLHKASVILVDDMAQMKFLYASTYPVLSHALERHERADLLCFRWQNYTKQHHLLPVSFVAGNDIPLAGIGTALDAMSRYLDTPLYRVGVMPGFSGQCEGWEHSVPLDGNPKRQSRLLVDALTAWIAERPDIRRSPVNTNARLMVSDLAHFCSVMARRESVDQVVLHFSSFYVGGQPASLPYLQKQLDAAGKAYVLVPSVTAEFIGNLQERYECLIVCGSWGDPPDTMPVIAFQHINQGWRVNHLGPAATKLRFMSRLNDTPPSAPDWFSTVSLGVEDADRETWSRARRADQGRFLRLG